MKPFFILVFFVISLHSFSQKNFDNSSIPHFTAGVTVGSISSSYLGKTNTQRMIIGSFSGMFIGAVKEMSDNMNTPNSGKFGDIVSTAVGGFVGSLIVNAAISRNSGKKKIRKIKECKM